MTTRATEIPQGAHLPACDGRPCSLHRRADRVYEDRLWASWQGVSGSPFGGVSSPERGA